MNYKFRMVSLLIIDSIVVLISIFLAHFFLNPFNPTIDWMLGLSSIILLISHHILCLHFHLYQRIWKYANIDELMSLCKVIVLSVLITAVSQLIIFKTMYERGLFLTLILHLVFLCGIRMFWRHLQLRRDKTVLTSPLKRKATLILGAGGSGRSISLELQKGDSILNPVVFLDDNPKLKNLEINGIPVVGGLKELDSVVEHYNIKHIIIAIPSLKGEQLKGIIKKSKRVCENVQIIPKYREFATGKINYSKFRNVSIEDLLGREAVLLDNNSISQKIKGKKVLVTGAGGSIGSELCRQIIKYEPSELILLDHSEFNIYQILRELQKVKKYTKLKSEILSVENRERVQKMMENHKPNIIFHAAAYKHVPLMEENIYSAVATNILGTKNVIDAADKVNVNSFVLISTDKAVSPSCIMGMTKRIAELIVNEKNNHSSTKYSSVRFGNVLGSSGSVVPLFKEQINNGGPVTVTHPEMTRYFMTIPEAAQLVIQAASFSKGGETFVLDMGQPVKIVDLAKQLINLSGFSEDEIEITYTGIREGEKIHEELFYEFEERYSKVHPKINAFTNEQYISDIKEKLQDNLRYSEEELEQLLQTILNNVELKKLVKEVSI
ncbi:nucleoside-diphosphate sugar epimerase/dehydratase [Lysinibacillus capsici]|uniref:polysaccharide biosynthesis protein n=1 Tax=Lysinibacillus capsici TaxID=2115968 RepID=UPI0029DE724D|nr:nucleoside-diphosphate sugar epimerase/dehydratase [Lysinibacillus capsici]WPK06047.1 nucleoside-diphosphate sugar epimerase/dehydratase [Lysinibacillus capsici]